MNCRHCDRFVTIYARGLCWVCWSDPVISPRYPSTPKDKGSRSPIQGNGNSDEPEEPTDAMPGTAEKVDVMAARAERGESLFHSEDPTLSWKFKVPGLLVPEGGL